MNLGLYKAKFWFRDIIKFMLPFFKNIDPNHISYAVVPVGIITGICYFYAPGYEVLYLVGIFLLFIRIILATIDGHVAQYYNKSSEKGEIVNKYTPEICDFALMGGIIYSSSEYYGIGIAVLIISWAISFFGMLGHLIGKGGESIGPFGQTDRIVILMIFSLLAYIGGIKELDYDFIYYFLALHFVAGILTICIRLMKTHKKCDLENE